LSVIRKWISTLVDCGMRSSWKLLKLAWTVRPFSKVIFWPSA